MKTVIVYDSNGAIYYQASGDVNEPVGQLYSMSIEVPDGKFIDTIDLTDAKNHIALLDSYETANMTLEERKVYYTRKAEENLVEYTTTHYLESACHGGVVAQYAIDIETQNMLTKAILLHNLAAQTPSVASTGYELEWHSVDGVCDNTWTIEEMQQLALEISAVYTPLVNKLQAIKAAIAACTTKQELENLDISIGE